MKTLDPIKPLAGLAAAGLAAASLACAPVREADPMPVAAAPDPGPGAPTAWNGLVLEVAEAEDGLLTLKGLRTTAMMHLAIHDALNAIAPRYEPWLGTLAAAPEADPVAAAAQAACEVASDQYPGEAERFAAERDRWLAGVADGPAEDHGRDLGTRSAAAVLAAREGDGWDTEAEYRWHPMGPGVYAEFNEHSGTPEGFVFGAGWAKARPFLLDEVTRFRAPPPPAIDSAEYAAAFAEVEEVGAFESPSRTADQSHLAMWWKEFVEKSHNRLARELAASDDLGLWEAARLFALLETSIYDGYVAVFADKFHYNHWRPYTAIRWASNDGNPATEEDPDWNNLHRHTYPFPSYPSAHGTACAAAMTVLADVFGEHRPLTMTIPEVDAAGPMSEAVPMDPPTRSFDSFAAAAEECALSRVYLGIHFRYDSVEGNRLGRRIGEFAVENFLRPVPR